MPITFHCGHCDSLLRTKDGSTGKIILCPKCGGQIEVPQPAGAPSEDQEPAPLDLPVFIRDTSGSASVRPVSMPPEPWYYKVLVFFSWVCVIFGVFGFCSCAVESVRLTKIDAGRAADIMMFSGAAFLLAFLVVGAICLIFVDIARNVRAMRYSARP